MEILGETRDGILVLTPLSRLDSNSSPQLETRAMAEITAGAGARRLVIDLSRVEYISSAGLRALLVVAKKLKEPGARLVLCGMAPSVRQIFELAGFLPIFNIDTTLDEALRRAAQ